MTDDERAAHDRAVQRVGRLSPVRSWPATGPGEVHPYYAALLQAPPIADHISALSEWFGAGATFPPVVREWADLVLARELDWNRAFYSHLETALAAGVRGEAARAVWDRRTDTLTPEEHELASYLVAVARGTVAPEAAQAIRARYGERMAVEITAFAGYLLLNFRVMQALDVPDRTAGEVAELIERLVPRETVAATSTALRVNGEERVVDADGDTPLLYVLRNALGLTGTLFGCGTGLCGACFVLVDGRAVPSCDTPLWSLGDADVTTVEGLAKDEELSDVQEAFLEEQAAQCGYCLPGILISATALLAENPSPTEDEVRAALDRNLCRCGSHPRMIAAVLRAAGSAP